MTPPHERRAPDQGATEQTMRNTTTATHEFSVASVCSATRPAGAGHTGGATLPYDGADPDDPAAA